MYFTFCHRYGVVLNALSNIISNTKNQCKNVVEQRISLLESIYFNLFLRLKCFHFLKTILYEFW